VAGQGANAELGLRQLRPANVGRKMSFRELRLFDTPSSQPLARMGTLKMNNQQVLGLIGKRALQQDPAWK